MFSCQISWELNYFLFLSFNAIAFCVLARADGLLAAHPIVRRYFVGDIWQAFRILQSSLTF